MQEEEETITQPKSMSKPKGKFQVKDLRENKQDSNQAHVRGLQKQSIAEPKATRDFSKQRTHVRKLRNKDHSTGNDIDKMIAEEDER